MLEEIDSDDQLVIPIDLYMNRLQRHLDDAYWTDNIDLQEMLQKRLECVNQLRELGEEFYTRF